MPSTHFSLYFHFIFSAKDRRPILNEQWQQQLYAYLGGIIRKLGGTLEAVGGTQDHIHLLVKLKPIHKISEVLRQIKHASSIWIKSKREIVFDWQEGYGAFSISSSQIERVKCYINTQKDHHQKKCFQDEYLAFLKNMCG